MFQRLAGSIVSEQSDEGRYDGTFGRMKLEMKDSTDYMRDMLFKASPQLDQNYFNIISYFYRADSNSSTIMPPVRNLKPAPYPTDAIRRGVKRRVHSEEPNSGATLSSSPGSLSNDEVERTAKVQRLRLKSDVTTVSPLQKGKKNKSAGVGYPQNTLESMASELDKIKDKYRLEKNRNQRLKRQNDKLTDQYNEANRKNEELEENLRLYRRSPLAAERERMSKTTKANTTGYYTLFSSLP
ncbi:hypothetical protein HD806DRAFT_492582 [Xylariaceae sp. AK1471]|nr:hypothetical protein HD806DRAFT_492582 [Xylariaceae sp. AK1471]